MGINSFQERYRSSLANPQLQLALAKATSKFADARRQATSDFGPDWDLLRERARNIKAQTLDHLDYYLEQFATNVERRGGSVFFADNAAEANSYITKLAREHNIRRAVKAKSMLSEEMELNRALEEAGIETIETDLGEFIIQLAGERPSHILAPAIHKTREEISELFKTRLAIKDAVSIDMITAIVRGRLRKQFAEADLGITGVNFAIAESGTIVLVENEGNICLSTSLPRVHVALMSIEKLIPRLTDLHLFLTLLTRSASGQKTSSYVSLLTGPRKSARHEGPEELHIIVLDNGRTQILCDPHLRESLYCIRCGACLNVCPIYQKIGGHAYGWIYSGPIGAVLTPQLIGRHKEPDLPFASTLCGACREACPLKIDIPNMLLHLRRDIKETTPLGQGRESRLLRSCGQRVKQYLERIIFKLVGAILRSASRYELVGRWARVVMAIGRGKGSRRLHGFASFSPLSIPALADRSFREQWAARLRNRDANQQSS